MDQLFSLLNHAVEGEALIALAASFVWGALSIILSPCHLASIPLIVGFISDQGAVSTRRALAISTSFAVGILITIAMIGVMTAAAGRMLGDLGGYGNYLVSGVFILVGLYLLGAIPLSLSGVNPVEFKRKGVIAAFILGLIFGIALGPCTFAYMAPMLVVSLKVGATNVGYALALLLFYGLGHCGIIVIAGTSVKCVQKVLNWNEQSAALGYLKKVCGLLVIAGGLWMIFTA